VSGSYFYPRERVTVSYYGARTVTLTTRSTRSGAFQVTFDGVVLGRCQGARIKAVGARGDAALIRIPLPACMP